MGGETFRDGKNINNGKHFYKDKLGGIVEMTEEGWEEKIDVNNVFKLQPARPVTSFGVGAIKSIDETLKELKKKDIDKLLVVTGSAGYKNSGAWDPIEQALKENDIEYSLYNKVRPNPTYTICDEAADIGKNLGAKATMGIGGGSPIDVAKTVAVLLEYPDKKAKQFYEEGVVIEKAVPIIAINTTHGTGTEVDSFAVAQSDGLCKPAIISPNIYPTYSIEDPSLTRSLSPEQTIATSVDAMNHVTESATTMITNPYSISLAKETVRLTVKYLPMAIAEPNNITARYWLMYASAIAGISFDIGFLHITHVMEHAMSALNPKVIHGIGLGILLPSVIKSIYPAVPEVLSAIYNPIIPELKGVPGEAEYVAKKVEEWLFGIGLTQKLNEYFTKDDIPKLTETALNPLLGMMLAIAPINVTEEVIKKIYEDSLAPMSK
ncbi:MAG: Alcohol dehydrogenase [Candidatus Methanolliviera sp. GoM_asphalt]|nr:MAG: Alcohol dehydrogenase [Candidatus Methanolliviera sp. GoM_asphalt]